MSWINWWEVQKTPELSITPEKSDGDSSKEHVSAESALKTLNSKIEAVEHAFWNLKWPDWQQFNEYFANEISDLIKKNKYPFESKIINGKIVLSILNWEKVDWYVDKLCNSIIVENNTVSIDSNWNGSFKDKEDKKFVVEWDQVKVESNEKSEFENITVEEWLAREKAEPWFLLKLCTEKIWENKYKVNFPNPQCEKAWWLSHLFMNDPHPAEITTSKWSQWVRQWLNWSFFAGKWYVEVLNGYEFEITKMRTDQEIKEIEEKNQWKISEILNSDKIKSIYMENGAENPQKKSQLEEIVSKSVSSDVDPYLMVSMMVNWSDWKFPIELSQLPWSLMMTLKHAQICKNEYSEIQNEAWIDQNWFYQNMLSLMILEEWNISDEKKKDVIKSYYDFYGKSFNEEDFNKAKEWYSKISRVWSRRSWQPYTGEVRSWYDKIDPKNLPMWSLDWINIPSTESLYAWAWKAFERYKDTIKNVCESLKIPENALVMLFIKEGSNGNPMARTPWSSAFWIAQTLTWTWDEITNKIAPSYGIKQSWDKYNADHQIIAWALYLRKNFEDTKNRWLALAKYNMWSINIDDSTAKKYAALNPAIARCSNWPITSWRQYLAAAVKYYTTA